MELSEDHMMAELMTGDCPIQVQKSLDLNKDGKEDLNCEYNYSTSLKQKKTMGKEQVCASRDLKAENAKLSASVQNYKDECMKLQGQVKSLKEELQVARTEVEGLEDEKDDLTRCLYRDTIEAQRLLEEKNDEISNLTDRYKKENLLLGDVQAKLISAEAERDFVVSENRRKLLATEKELDQFRDDYTRLDVCYQTVKEENVRLKAKVDALADRIGSLQNDVMFTASQWEARNLEEENQPKIVLALEMIKAEHKTTTDDLQRRNSELQEALAKTKDHLKASELQRSILEEDMFRFQSLISSLQDKVFLAEASHQKAEEMVKDLIKGKAVLRNELELFKEKLEAEKETQREASGKITELLDQVKKTEELLIRTKDHVSKQAQEMEELTKHKGILEDAVQNLEVENLKLERRLLKRKNTIESLEAELEYANQEKEKLKLQLSEATNENIHIQEELRESQDMHSEEEALRKLWQDEVVSRSMLGLRVVQIEREKQTTLTRLKRETRRYKSALHLKERLDFEVKQEKQKNVKLRRRVNRLKARLAFAQKEKVSVLKSLPTKAPFVTKDSIANVLKQEQLDDATLEQNSLLHRSRHLSTENHKLRDMQLQLGGQDVEPRLRPTEASSYWRNEEIRKKAIIPNLDDLTFHMLNTKLKEINTRLAEQVVAREQSEKLRNANDTAVRAEFQRIKDNLKGELTRLHKENFELVLERDSAIKEGKKFQTLYEDQRLQQLNTLAALEAAKNRLFKRQQQ